MVESKIICFNDVIVTRSYNCLSECVSCIIFYILEKIL